MRKAETSVVRNVWDSFTKYIWFNYNINFLFRLIAKNVGRYFIRMMDALSMMLIIVPNNVVRVLMSLLEE